MRRKLAFGALLLGVGAAHPAASQPEGAAATGSAAAATERSDPRHGIVHLERAGQALGLGVVLRTDGRILTALSAVGHGNDIEARFFDGARLPVAVVLSDRAGDLALLVTQGVHWTTGLRPSMRDPAESGVRLRRFKWRGGRLEETAAVLEGRRSLIGRDGAVLGDMLLVQGRFGDDELGSPLIDEVGEVLSIAVQACSPEPTGNCRMAPFGAPMTALKSFLKKAPPREPPPAARLGFKGTAAHEGSIAGVRVLSVEPGSPAALAGLRAGTARGGEGSSSGDLVVAVEDVPVTTPEELHDAVNRAALALPRPGTAPSAESPASTTSGAPTKNAAPDPKTERQVRLLVYGSGKFRQAAMPLRPMPQIAQPIPSTPSPATVPAPSPAAAPPPQTAPAPAAPAPPP